MPRRHPLPHTSSWGNAWLVKHTQSHCRRAKEQDRLHELFSVYSIQISTYRKMLQVVRHGIRILCHVPIVYSWAALREDGACSESHVEWDVLRAGRTETKLFTRQISKWKAEKSIQLFRCKHTDWWTWLHYHAFTLSYSLDRNLSFHYWKAATGRRRRREKCDK
jgi:hypothetical protein